MWQSLSPEQSYKRILIAPPLVQNDQVQDYPNLFANEIKKQQHYM